MYLQLGEEEFGIVRRLDGTASVAELSAEGPQFSKIASVLEVLERYRLLDGQEPPPVRAHPRTSLFLIPLVSWDTRLVAKRSAALARVLVSRPVAALVLAATVLGGRVIVTNWAQMVSEARHGLNDPSVFVVAVVCALVAAVVHEAAHGLALVRFGGTPRRAGLILLYGSPALYCDVSGSYLLPGRWRRAVVAVAGLCVNLIVAMAAAFAFGLGLGSPWLHAYLALMCLSGLVVIALNSCPFVKLDGYWILSALVNTTNLYPRSTRSVIRLARSLLSGQLPKVKSWPQFLYGTAAIVTTGLLLALSALTAWRAVTESPPARIALVAMAVLAAVGALRNRSRTRSQTMREGR